MKLSLIVEVPDSYERYPLIIRKGYLKEAISLGKYEITGKVVPVLPEDEVNEQTASFISTGVVP